jgi:hypothetical protein
MVILLGFWISRQSWDFLNPTRFSWMKAIIFTGLTRQGIQLPKGQLEKLGFGLKGALETSPISRLWDYIYIYI